MTAQLNVDIVYPVYLSQIRDWYGVDLTPSQEHWDIFQNWVTHQVAGDIDHLSRSALRDSVRDLMKTSYDADLTYYLSKKTRATIGVRIVFPNAEQMTFWMLQWS